MSTHGNKPVTWFYLRVIPAQGELQDEDTLHRSFGKRLAHHQQPCTLPTHCQCKSFRECPAAGGGLPTPPQARGEALTHWCPPGMLANCCPPPQKTRCQQEEISLPPGTYALVVAWTSHHFLDLHQARSSTSVLQLHTEQQQKQPRTQQSSPPPS